ncbi:MAG: protein kinase [Timaviella obliquedivisa GSE-PSE-MK23-08B]|jgi:WD40 repeat protein/serine/threonine protein kinase|nr:protein kinase [Timaviella obliquedivisa GSE-PSE-MK23-08B]
MSNQNSVQWQAGNIILDLYKVVGILGQGSFGEVYKTRHLGWNTDLSVHSPSSATLTALGGNENFEQQVKTWIRLGLHSHIAGCYYIRYVNDHPLVFTEHVAGGSLRNWIGDRRLYSNGTTLALRRILDIAIQLAWGLHYAHEQGIIHEHVTPNTVLMTAAEEAKITDFGLAKADTTAIAYLAPEQHRQALLTQQTDLWGWGLTVLEMFVGQCTWATGTTAMQALDHYLEHELKEAQLPRMPVQVAQLLQRCFQDSPDDRPASLREVANLLQALYLEAMGRPYLRQEPPLTPTTADDLNNKAVFAWDLGQLTEAFRLWEQALINQPRHLEAIYNRGLMLWRSGRVSDDQALLRQLEQQLEMSRSSTQDWRVEYLLSLVQMERGNYQTALQILEGVHARGIQQDDIRAALTLAKERLPHAKQLLPQLGEATQKKRTNHKIKAITLSPTSLYALSSGEEKAIRLWDIAKGRCLCLFKGHEEQVLSVAFSPDGCSILSGGDDQTVRLWNVGDASQVHTFDGGERRVIRRDTGNLFKPLGILVNKLRNLTRQWGSQGHQGAVRSVTFSAEGRYVLSGGDDQVIKLWMVATGECLQTFRRHQGRISTVLFHPDRQHILSASDDQTIKVWEIATGQAKQTFEGHHDLTSMACSPDGLSVLAGDNPIKLWNMTTGHMTRTFEGHQGAVRAVAFSPDGRFFLSAGDDQLLKLWEVKTGRCLRTFEGHESVIRAIVLSSDGQHVLSADASTLNWWAVHSTDALDLAPLRLSNLQLTEPEIGGDRLYEQELAQSQAALEEGDAVTAAQHIRQARAQLGYNRGSEAVQAWLNLYTALPRQTLKDSWEPIGFERYTAALHAVAFNLAGNSVLAGSADATLKLWDIATSRCLLSFEGHKGEVAAVALSPVGHSALSGSADATLKLWNVTTAECLRTLTGHTAGVSSAAFSPTGRYALSGSRDTTLKLWEIATGRCLQTLKGHRDAVMAVAFGSDGRSVISASADKTLKHWDIATGECLNTFEGHVAAVYAVDWSADGRSVVSGSADQTLKLWTTDGECLRTFAGHAGAVRSVSLSTDGRYALSGSDDKTCKLWNAVTGDCLWTFAGHTAAVRAVSLSPDGRYVFSGSDDQFCKAWLLDWELAEQPPRNWDEGASPYLESFLRLHTPSVGILPASRQPSAEEITLALTYEGTPTWTEVNFNNLMQTLKAAGYGWLQPNGVRQQLNQMVKAIAKPVAPIAQVVQVAQVPASPEAPAPFATAFATEFATAFTSSEPKAKVILSVIAGSLQGLEVEFDDRTICIIGRAKDCHVQLPNDELHKTISRYHCLLDINPPAARIRDLGSLHGTYINGQMIGKRQRDQTPEEGAQINFPEHDLADGDEIKLGQTIFSVKLESLAKDEPVDAGTNKPLNPFTGFLNSVPLVESSGGESGHENGLELPLIEGYTPVKQLTISEAGVTYLARQNATDQLVTLKVMLPQKAVRPSVVEAFLQEIELIKTLQHPSIIRLLDSGYQNDAFFFAMDACEGGSVVELMQQRGGRLPVDEAVAIALQVLEGLEYAHQVRLPVGRFTERSMRSAQGLVHCDLKPSNILLSAGSVQTVKIADYGLAKAFDQAGLGGLSMSGTAANLPVFMPRQQAVNFNYAEAEVDVWAIAACLYYMLTGTYPRNFSSGKDPYLVLLQTDPISISQREVTILQPIANLIDQALVDNPQIIFKTATAFKQALKEIS